MHCIYSPLISRASRRVSRAVWNITLYIKDKVKKKTSNEQCLFIRSKLLWREKNSSWNKRTKYKYMYYSVQTNHVVMSYVMYCVNLLVDNLMYRYKSVCNDGNRQPKLWFLKHSKLSFRFAKRWNKIKLQKPSENPNIYFLCSFSFQKLRKQCIPK